MSATRGKSEPAAPADAVHRLSSARLAAVQAIYQIDMTAAPADAVVTEFIRYRGGATLDGEHGAIQADQVLFDDIVHGVESNRAELDRMIGSRLTADWPLERIEKVMAAILRAGAYELSRRAHVPARVIISEYVDVSHAFLDGKEVGMVNGVLDSLARVLREAEMGIKSSANRKADDETAG